MFTRRNTMSTDVVDQDTPAKSEVKADTLAKMENGMPRKQTVLEKCELPTAVPFMVI